MYENFKNEKQAVKKTQQQQKKNPKTKPNSQNKLWNSQPYSITK